MEDLNLISAIKKEIGGSITRNPALKYEEISQLFIDFMRLPISDAGIGLDGCSRILNAINKTLLDGVEKEERDTFLGEFTKVEPFLRKVLLYVNKTKYQTIEVNKDGFMPLINELALNPGGIKLDSPYRPHDSSPLYIDHFIKIYSIRNSEAHKIKEYSSRETGEFIESALMIYIYVCDKYKHQIKAAIEAYSEIVLPSFNGYCDEIINTFKEKIGRIIHLQSKENVTLSSTYVSEFVTKGIEERDTPVRDGTVDELRKTKLKENRMILWGEAGMGKTTTLEYLTYRDAVDYKRNNENSIPVLLPLGFLTEIEIPLRQYIFGKLKVDAKIGEVLIEKGRINLFLDGLNEIPFDEKNQLRTYRQKEIEGFINGNKKLFIVISNRPHEVNIYPNVPVFIIQKMNDKQIDDFINKYTEGQKDLGLLLKEKIGLDERLKEIVRTPLMLSRLIEILKTDGVIPENEGKIIERFIRSIYKREKIEKKDANFNEDAIHRLLAYLASYCIEYKHTNSGLTQNEVYSAFQKCKKEYGFTIDISYAVDILVQLNILEVREKLYSFSHQSYLDYFFAEYERMILI
jgi:hypothetical protein